jgi:hypothetical protein
MFLTTVFRGGNFRDTKGLKFLFLEIAENHFFILRNSGQKLRNSGRLFDFTKIQ